MCDLLGWEITAQPLIEEKGSFYCICFITISLQLNNDSDLNKNSEVKDETLETR